MNPLRLLWGLQDRSRLDGEHSSPTGPVAPAGHPDTTRVAREAQRHSPRRSPYLRPAADRGNPALRDLRALADLAVLTRARGDPLTAARALFAPELLENR